MRAAKVGGPIKVDCRLEQVSDLMALAPPHLTNRNESGGWSPSYCHDELLALLDATNQLGCLATHLAQPYPLAHGLTLAQMLLSARVHRSCRE